MFVQLRRVVYLLVLLQCCACVAYAENVESSGPADAEYLDILNKTPNEWNDRKTEEVIVKATSVHSVFLEEAASWWDFFASIDSLSMRLKRLIKIKKEKGIKKLSDWDNYNRSGFDRVMKNVAVLKKNTSDSLNMLNVTMQYCKRWEVVLDKVIDRARQPNGSGASGLSTTGGTTAAFKMPNTTYNELIHLSNNLTLATVWNGFLVKDPNDALEEMEKLLHELVGDESSAKAMLEELMKSAEKELKPPETFDARFKRMEAKVKTERLGKACKQGEGHEPKEEHDTREAGTVNQAGDAGTTAKRAGGRTITISTNAASAAAFAEAVGLELRDAANAPTGYTAVLAVLALTVSTVIGVTAV